MPPLVLSGCRCLEDIARFLVANVAKFILVFPVQWIREKLQKMSMNSVCASLHVFDTPHCRLR